MRAKRSKKYRKIMSSYQMTFSFREPYQVLLDSHFLKACHHFHMPLQKYLENTLHGECKLFITKCTLAKIMDEFEKQKQKQNEKDKQEGKKPRGPWRPDFLPPPTEVPLRHCKHKNEEGEDLEVVSEARCLLDLLAGQPRGNELAKNKQHYILATAEADEKERKSKGFLDVRERARLIPGVPIVYVKRSVMILEELSAASEAFRRKGEKEKLAQGLLGVGDRKRKRADGEESEDELDLGEEQSGPKIRGLRRAKGPNPLSVKKKKAKGPAQPGDSGADGTALGQESQQKRKRRRKHGAHKSGDNTGNPAGQDAKAPATVSETAG